jgi:hypothetical protein
LPDAAPHFKLSILVHPLHVAKRKLPGAARQHTLVQDAGVAFWHSPFSVLFAL